MRMALARLALGLVLSVSLTGAALAAPRYPDVKANYRASDVQVLDRDGVLLQRVRADSTVRKGQWLALADVSPALRSALVFSEDKRFYEHSGVDWRGVSAAAWANLWSRKTRGASTITMQLAGLFDEDLRRVGGNRSVVQKVGQAVSAEMLERTWRKDQILEAYLNLVPFRGELVGIDALSRTLFGKAASGLDNREAAIAAALVRAPNAPGVQVGQRACTVLQAMEAAASARDCDGIVFFAQAVLQRREFVASEGIAPHLARQVLRHSSGAGPQAFRTTVRAPLQRMALQSLNQQLRELRARHVEDGAIVVLDNASGEVLAWVGSSGALSAAAEVDGVLALRQPGSTLKPFLYAQAIAQRRITAASLLDDSGAQIQTSGGLYIPQNYDHQFKGWVSARTALGASLNVPAVRTLVMVSPDAFHQQLTALGLSLRETGDYYGYSLALGSADVSLLQLTNAYRALANRGCFSPSTFVPEGGHRTPGPCAVDPRAAFIVSDILADSNARARTFGSDSVLATRFWSAVKTGTSKDMRDNWAIGYSERYTVGVWVGNASGAPMWDVSGTSGAAPVWADVMRYLHRATPSRAPPVPAGLVRQAVTFPLAPSPVAVGYGIAPSLGAATEAARMEWFIQGTEQSQFALSQGSVGGSATQRAGMTAARIISPANGSIIALDPDIPPDRQRLRFVADGSFTRWLMDGKPFAKGAQAQWLPWPGRHLVQIVGTNGEVLDSIRLEVRGAGVTAKR